MSSGADFFLKKTLGEDFFESLQKFELWKPGTKTTLDHEEIKTALKIVPRAIMSYLIAELVPMQIGETKELSLSVKLDAKCLIRVTKHERDVYSGDIEENNKKIVDFKYRSIPGVGLVIMSAFELYDTDHLLEQPKNEISDATSDAIQKIIDERLALHDLVGKVVDKKLSQRDAIQQLVLAKLSEVAKPKPISIPHHIEVPNSMINKQESIPVESKPKKHSPLKDFLDGRQKKIKKAEYPIQMAKGENVHCPDCGKNIFDGNAFSGCICYGDDMDKKIYIKKSEEGVKVRFGRGWDPENIEMFLEVLRRKRG